MIIVFLQITIQKMKFSIKEFTSKCDLKTFTEEILNGSFIFCAVNDPSSNNRSSHQRCSVKNCVVRNFAKFTGKYLCQSLFFNIKKETLAQVFSCEFCEISNNTFFTEHLRATAFVMIREAYIYDDMIKDI